MLPPDENATHITCRCGEKLGFAYYLDGVFVGAQIGGVIVQTLHGRCANCDRGVHVQVSAKEAMKLFARYGGISPITVEFTE